MAEVGGSNLGESSELSDQELVVRTREGDDEAPTELYSRYAARLRGLADRQISEGLRRILEPDDIVQSAFRSLFRGVNSGSYDAPEGRSLWRLLAVIAIHKVRRRASRNRSVSASSFSGEDDDEQSGSMNQVVGELSPEQFESCLRESIESLKPVEQEIVQLRVQGFTVEEISDRLHRSCRTIERFLQKIRQELGQQLDIDS